MTSGQAQIANRGFTMKSSDVSGLKLAMSELEETNNNMSQHIANFLNAPSYSTEYTVLQVALGLAAKYPHAEFQETYCKTYFMPGPNGGGYPIRVTKHRTVHDTAKYKYAQSKLAQAKAGMQSTENKIVAAADPLINNGTQTLYTFDQTFQKYQFSLPTCKAANMFTNYYLNTVKPTLTNLKIPSVVASTESLFGSSYVSSPEGYLSLQTFANTYKNWSSQAIFGQLSQLITYFNNIWTSQSCK